MSDVSQIDIDPPAVFSVGHSTRPLAELVSLLRVNGIKTLVDVRTVPKSRTNPQFNKDKLEVELLRDYGLEYVWLGKQLGGLRKADKLCTINAGWDNDSFRGFADYMQTPAFSTGLEQLLKLARDKGPISMMCAEVVYFRCHRRLIADALAARGITVQHLTAPGRPPSSHKLTQFAHLQGSSVTYPAYNHTVGQSKKRDSQKAAPLKASSKRGRVAEG